MVKDFCLLTIGLLYLTLLVVEASSRSHKTDSRDVVPDKNANDEVESAFNALAKSMEVPNIAPSRTQFTSSRGRSKQKEDLDIKTVLKDNQRSAQFAESIRYMMQVRKLIANPQTNEQPDDVSREYDTTNPAYNTKRERRRRRRSFEKKIRNLGRGRGYKVFRLKGSVVKRTNHYTYRDAKAAADGEGSAKAIVTNKSAGLLYVNPPGYYGANYVLVRTLLTNEYRDLDTIIKDLNADLRLLVQKAKNHKQIN